jgi:hypothetical protein
MNVNNINNKNALRVINWCYEQYGYSLYNGKRVKLVIINDYCLTNKNIYGEYTTKKEIIIYKKTIKSFKVFVMILIHEYIHHLQNGDMYNKYHFEYNRNYEHHPYEITADNISKRDYKQCIKEVFKNERQKKKN